MSCEDKVENYETNTLEKSRPIERCDFEPHGVYIDNGMEMPSENNMLKFPDYLTFEQTVINLENQVEEYDDLFLAQNSNLSEDELDDLEEDIDYNPDTPLINFEQYHEFYSLRSYSESLEDTWLDNSDQTNWSWDDDPTADIFVDGVEQTIYNPYYEFIVCNTLYKLTKEGNIYIPLDFPELMKY